MKPVKPTTDDLKTQLFARRRSHEAGNRPTDTIEKRQKRERMETLAIGIGAIVFTPFLVALLVYTFHLEKMREPLPWWLILSTYFVIIISIPSCMFAIDRLVNPRPSCGRWIIAFSGIFHRYGKSPHRFVPLDSLRNVRVEKPQSLFPVVVFDTDQEPLRIGEQIRADRKPTEFLPFLNYLIARLRQNGWSSTDLTPLLNLQQIHQRRVVHRQYFQFTVWLMMACYFVPCFCVFPFFSYILNLVPYPAILWVGILCVAVVGFAVYSIGSALNSRLKRWKNKKIDAMIRTLAEGENV